MKRRLVLVFIFFVILGILLLTRSNKAYAYVNCAETVISPKEVTTLNLKTYIENNNYEVVSFCSFDMCYIKREDTIEKSINNFKMMFDKYLSEDDFYELNVKGYPITKIVINAC